MHNLDQGHSAMAEINVDSSAYPIMVPERKKALRVSGALSYSIKGRAHRAVSKHYTEGALEAGRMLTFITHFFLQVKQYPVVWEKD